MTLRPAHGSAADAPPPDFHVDVGLAARLVSSQHPDLAGPLALVANGWDNAIFRLGEDLAVRLPRRVLAVPLLEHEQRWLPDLAGHLPVAVPTPVRIGRPSPELGYDVPWSIVPWLAGRSATEFRVEQRDVAARELAVFVTALARPAPPDAPNNAYRGVPLAHRDDTMRTRFAGGRLTDAARLVPLWDRALAAPAWAGPKLWVHADLHPANLLLATSGHLSAVIDFGDLTAGDPATDLATAWLTFGPEGRRTFRTEVEARMQVDAATWERARGWALVIASAVVEATGTTSPLGRVAAYVLDQLIAD